MKLTPHPQAGILYRPGSQDAAVFKEVLKEYKDLQILEGSTVFDLGAHIGFFTARALEKGAGKVVSFEPDPKNFDLLRTNFERDPRVTACNLAVSDGASPKITFYQKTNSTAGTILKTRKTSRSSGNLGEFEVEALSLPGVFDRFGVPTTLKVDVEGAELFWDWKNLPSGLRFIGAEITLRQRTWRARADDLIQTIESQGFRSVLKPDLDSVKWWDYSRIGVWER